MPSLTNRNQTNTTSDDSDKKATDPPPGPPPIPAPPLSPGLLTKAEEFVQLFLTHGADNHLYGGQGAPTRAMRAELIKKVWTMKADALKNELVGLIQGSAHNEMRRALLHSEVRLSDTRSKNPSDPDHGRLPGVLRLEHRVNTTEIYKKTTKHARELLKDPQVSAADRALALEILDDPSANGGWSWSTVGNWLAVKGLAPITFDKVSLPRVLALYLNCTVQCAGVAAATAQKLFHTRGVSPSVVPAFTGVTLTSVPDSALGKPNVILQYNATQLEQVMPKVRSVLEQGYLSAGCLSGFSWDKDHPRIEHYIMLFAAEADQFLFWDPDVGSTNIIGIPALKGNSIGILYYDHADPAKASLSTGIDFADLSTLSGGDHRAFPTRHRYQVQTLAKV